MILQQVLLRLFTLFAFLNALLISLEPVIIFFFQLNLEFGSEENAYDEDEGETSTCYLPSVYEGSKSAQRKRKNLKSYTSRPSDPGTDLPYVHYSTGTQSSMIFGKRPASLNVGSIPTKRMRTASRHRVVSPFTVSTGTLQTQAKTDASSGDTNSCPDDHSNLHVGALIQKSMEVESVRDFEKQLSYDCAETSIKTKKRKKSKNLVIINFYLCDAKAYLFLEMCGYFIFYFEICSFNNFFFAGFYI